MRRGRFLLFILCSGVSTFAHEEPSASVAPATHWAYAPLRAEVPPVDLADPTGFVRTPIDAFILASLREHGLEPAPRADPRTLIRRVYYDLIGLPPTPEEVEAFVADSSQQSYARVVDRLLDSPHHGERWARHWMDVVHYADSHGNDQDRARPHAWPYRDYLIDAFNSDLPYPQFIREQIAGDVLFPDDARAVAATGCVAAGPWDESSLLNVMEDTLDKQAARNLDRDDMLTTVMATFTSTSVQCARCHDHKFDPIAQTEYYRLQSVFAGVDRADRTLDQDPSVARARRELRERLRRLQVAKAAQDQSLLGPKMQTAVEEFEKQLDAVERAFTALTPESIESENGSTFCILPDGSVLAGSGRPEVETYTITVRVPSLKVSALRLELLNDESLPHGGPGRQDNGNLHLNEIELSLLPAPDSNGSGLGSASASEVAAGPVPLARSSSPAGDPRKITVLAAVADFNQDGWGVERAIDGDTATAWGIFPQVGEAHQAWFHFEAIEPTEAARLRIVLRQTHGGGHLIGRFRVALGDHPWPAPAVRAFLPRETRERFAVPAVQRDAAQRIDLAVFCAQRTIERELSRLPAPSYVYAITHDFPRQENFAPALTPRPVHVLWRGAVERPLEEVTPGALSLIPGHPRELTPADPQDEGARRVALADWIADPHNVLTWRSIVNRVWHYHFGRGLVDTPNDFGKMGSPPSHPALLDWLAQDFLDHSATLKRLHRLIVTSSVYQQSSRVDPKALRVDAGNVFLWRMHRLRLDAESARDSILAITGRLDLAMGGPPVKQFIESPGEHVTPEVDYEGFDVDAAENRRRSVYRFVYRTLPDPFMEALDCPDAAQLVPVRNASVTPLMAMALWNDAFVLRHCEHLAAAVVGTGDLDAQVGEAWRRVLLRAPSAAEQAESVAYTRQHGMANLCRVLFNLNEFLFLD